MINDILNAFIKPLFGYFHIFLFLIFDLWFFFQLFSLIGQKVFVSKQIIWKLKLLKNHLFTWKSIFGLITFNELFKFKIAIWGLYLILSANSELLLLFAGGYYMF